MEFLYRGKIKKKRQWNADGDSESSCDFLLISVDDLGFGWKSTTQRCVQKSAAIYTLNNRRLFVAREARTRSDVIFELIDSAAEEDEE